MFKRIRRVLVLAVFLFAGYKAYRVHQDVKQVMTYQPMVREILSEKDTPANEELVLAMIYTETKGKEGDVMQSSESASGSTNTINDNASSIRQGVQTLTDNLYLAQKKGVDVWTAVQAYNFGPAYIDFIAQNGKENTLALAKQYSRETVAPFAWQYHWKDLQLYSPHFRFSRCRTLCKWRKLLLFQTGATQPLHHQMFHSLFDIWLAQVFLL